MRTEPLSVSRFGTGGIWSASVFNLADRTQTTFSKAIASIDNNSGTGPRW